jgi:hypothetical protein
MQANHETELLLKSHFDLHLARIKSMAAMIMAIISSRSVQLSVLSRFYGASERPDSAFKRMQRFLRQVSLPSQGIALLILSILGLEKDKKLTLILDRTNWQFGRCHINVLFLCVVWKGVGVPIFFKFLVDKKQGNSCYMDRIELVEKAIALVGKSGIAAVLGDREFVGKRWILWLRRAKIPFVMRLNHGTTKIDSRGVGFFLSKNMFARLKKGRKRFLGYCFIGEYDSVKCCVCVTRTLDNELLVLAYSEDIVSPLSLYRERWKIESMFRCMKTGGFNLEGTHITDSKRIATLLCLVAIAYAFALKAGYIATQDQCPTYKKTDIGLIAW